MRILLTGFEGFAGRDPNPSWEAVRELDGEIVAGAWVQALRLPVVWRRSVATLVAELEREPVDGLIIGGLAYARGSGSGSRARPSRRTRDRTRRCAPGRARCRLSPSAEPPRAIIRADARRFTWDCSTESALSSWESGTSAASRGGSRPRSSAKARSSRSTTPRRG
ncbi:MAG: hypothetical protein M3O91_01365 [Chloroflexota bacterium]|nr:hypothetical protein [Chloroflexota bacterium]